MKSCYKSDDPYLLLTKDCICCKNNNSVIISDMSELGAYDVNKKCGSSGACYLQKLFFKLKNNKRECRVF